MITVEVCVSSPTSALIAQEAGAHRVELCAALPEGGTTPSYGTVKKTLEQVDIPVFPIIRPRSGDFLYSQLELEMMLADIEAFNNLGVHGFSFGVLDKYGNLDKEANALLLAACQGKPATLHRAFDRTCDMAKALEDAIDLGFERVLTSGGATTAPNGIEWIERLVSWAGNRISIMAGAGIRPENVKMILEQGLVKEIHGTFQSEVPSQMLLLNTSFPERYSETIGEASYKQADGKIIRSILGIVESLSWH